MIAVAVRQDFFGYNFYPFSFHTLLASLFNSILRLSSFLWKLYRDE